MNARLFVCLDEVLVDAVVDYVPVVGAGNVNHRVVGSAVDGVLGVLLQCDRLFCHGDRSKRRFRCAVSHVIVGRTSVVDRPHEVVQTVAVEHVGCLAIGIVLQSAALRSEHFQCVRLNIDHVLL